jgi:hypothetical protein
MFYHPKYYAKLKKIRLENERKRASEQASEQGNERASKRRLTSKKRRLTSD